MRRARRFSASVSALGLGLLFSATSIGATTPVPMLIADVNTGNGPVLGSDPGSFVRLTATLTVFTAFDPVHGRELWITDGTGANTHLLYDFCPGACSGNPTPLNTANALALGTLYVSADDGARGAELWSVSSAGAVAFVRDINLGALGSNPGALAGNSGTTMVSTSAAPTVGYFAATSAGSGTELWKTTGSLATTVLVKDINTGTQSSSMTGIGAGQTHVYFAATAADTGTELYISDGTGGGTVLRSDINPTGNSSPMQFAQLTGDTVFFSADDGATGREPWITTATTTTFLKDILPGPSSSNLYQPIAFNGRIYFGASSASFADTELWSTNGTPGAGTSLFKDICGGACSGSPRNFVTLNTAAGLRLLFLANLTGGFSSDSLYVSDGTSGATTTSIFFSSGGLGSLTVSGSRAYFTDQTNKRLYVTDGTMAGTSILKDYTNFAGLSIGGAVGTNKIIVVANDGFSGNEPYIAGPTSATFSLLKNIAPDLGYSNPQALTNVNGTLYFSAFGETTGRELWKVADPNLGAEPVTDLVVGAVGSNPTELTAFGGKLLFVASPTGSGTKVIYVSDGTPGGTHPLKDLGAGVNLVYINCLSVVGNRIYFNASGNDGKGSGPWISDGTDAGTLDINPGGLAISSCPVGTPGFASAGNKVLFAGGDSPRGTELWRTDGTAPGTAFLRDIATGTSSSNPNRFLSIGNFACFSAKQDGANDEEPWCSDGTAQGTVALGDLNSGTDGSQPLSFTRIGNSLVFSAFSPPTYNRRMWRSDGTLNSAVPLSSGYSSAYSLVGLPTQTFPGNGARPDPPRVEFDGNLIYYSCEVTQSQLCISDVRPGLEDTLTHLITISSGTNVGGIDQLRVFPGGDALMSCFTASSGRELCRYRSADNGHDSPLLDIAPGAASSSPEQFTLVGDYIYFTADDGAHGRELWAVLYKDTIDRIFHGDFD